MALEDAPLLEQYDVLGRIGRGAMAEVYAVRHREQGAVYALKVISLPHPRLLERFERERTLQAQIRHPHVLPILEQLAFSGRPALLLPYVPGPTLERLLAEGKPPAALTAALFRQIVEGVAAIHAAGLIHRDLKPSNVLLDPSSGELLAKVSDFGLAKALESDTFTQTGILLGTPAYAAPEQITNAAHVDARADVFALGTILAEMLTGVRPEVPLGMRETQDAEIVQSSQIPPLWRALVERLQHRDPALRPANASEVARLLPTSSATIDDPRWIARVQALTAPLPQPTLLPQAERLTQGLPAERDTFVGRTQDIYALDQLLNNNVRLVSVLGIGGVGKTRLVNHFAWANQARWPGGIWFCDLSEATDIEGILYAVARALDVQIGPEDPVGQIGAIIGARGRCLVCLDGFERVKRQAQQTLGRWLDRAGGAQFIVTTRERLELPGESLLLLEPLPREDATQLFLRRAKAARRDFSTALPDALATLIDLLDGLPLAIELCAARAAAMTPAQMLERMNERFRLLVSQSGRPNRHTTLRGALDWSFDLLTEPERAGLAQLSVFDGGFTLEAAEAVIVSEAWAADIVQGLVDKSFVHRIDSTPRARMSMLKSVQAYATEKLQQRGGQAAAEERHGKYFATFAKDMLQAHSQGTPLLKVISAEITNLSAATHRAVLRKDATTAHTTARAMFAVLFASGPLSRAIALAEEVLTLPATSHGAHNNAGIAYYSSGRWHESSAHYREALSIARGERQGIPADRAAEAQVLNNIANLHVAQNRHEEARVCYETALAIHRDLDNRRGEGELLGNIGLLASRQGNRENARACYWAALALHRKTGNRLAEGQTLSFLGYLALAWGQLAEAMLCYEDALAIFRECGDRRREGTAFGSLGYVQMLQGRFAELPELFERALTIHREVGHRHSEGVTLTYFGIFLRIQGHKREARRIFDEALAIHRAGGHQVSEISTLLSLGALHIEQQQFSEAQLCLEGARDRARAIGNRSMEGLALSDLGRLALCEGKPDALAHARRQLDEGDALLRYADLPLWWADHLCTRAALEIATGDYTEARGMLAEARAIAERAEMTPEALLLRDILELELTLEQKLTRAR